MGYFQVRYDSRVVIYDRRGFIRLATGQRQGSTYRLCCCCCCSSIFHSDNCSLQHIDFFRRSTTSQKRPSERRCLMTSQMTTSRRRKQTTRQMRMTLMTMMTSQTTKTTLMKTSEIFYDNLVGQSCYRKAYTHKTVNTGVFFKFLFAYCMILCLFMPMSRKCFKKCCTYGWHLKCDSQMVII